jgi:hypothetical protein
VGSSPTGRATLYGNLLKQQDLDKTPFTPTICFIDRWAGMARVNCFSAFFC